LGVRHRFVAGNPSLHGAGERRKLARLDKMEEVLRDTLERVRFDIAAAKSQARWECKKRWHYGCERARRVRCERERKKLMGRKVLNPCPTRGFKGTSAAPCLRRRARRVSGTFAHTCAPQRNSRPLTRRLDPRGIRTCNVYTQS
jgi:hypothetical protein